MQSDLADWCRWLKSLGYLVKIDTNGIAMNRLFELRVMGVVDYIAVDIKTTRGAIDEPLRFYRKEVLSMFDRRYMKGEFRVTCVRPKIQEDLLASILKEMNTEIPVYLQHCKVTLKILDPGAFKSGKCVAWTPEEIQAFVDQYGREYNVKVR